MKNKLVLIVVSGLLGFSAHTQTLSPTVISSSGGFYTSATAELSTTVAEMTMVQTFITSGNILTQGFQQPEDYSVGIDEIPFTEDNILIYPNPSSGNFVLSYTCDDNSEANIRIYNLAGQIVLEKQVSPLAGLNTIKFDIGTYSQGMYVLEFTSTNSRGEKNTNYHKISLEY